MAKGKVTQDEFEQSLGAAEGMGALKSSGAPRDNPFVKKGNARKPTNGAATKQSSPIVQAVSPKEQPITGSRVARAVDGPLPAPGPSAAPVAAPARRFKDPLLEEVPFSFRYTYRELGDQLARQLQRRKKRLPGDRITAAMVYRVFAEIGLDDFVLEDADLVLTEAELKALVRTRLGLPHGSKEG